MRDGKGASVARDVIWRVASEIAYIALVGGLFGVVSWMTGDAASVEEAALRGLWFSGALLAFDVIRVSIQVVKRRRRGVIWRDIVERRRSHTELLVVGAPFFDAVAAAERTLRSLTRKDPDVERRRGRSRVRTGGWFLDPGDTIEVRVCLSEEPDTSRVTVRSAPAWRGDLGPDNGGRNVRAISAGVTGLLRGDPGARIDPDDGDQRNPR